MGVWCVRVERFGDITFICGKTRALNVEIKERKKISISPRYDHVGISLFLSIFPVWVVWWVHVCERVLCAAKHKAGNISPSSVHGCVWT